MYQRNSGKSDQTKASPHIKAKTVQQFDREMAERRVTKASQHQPPPTPNTPSSCVKTIPMPAFGKARPRVTRNGTFMPKDYERQRAQLKMMYGPVEVEGLVRLSVTAVRKLPKKTQHNPGDHCTPGPDVDNLAGAVMDALFSDDSCVISVYCEKIWGEDDSLIIRLYEVKK